MEKVTKDAWKELLSWAWRAFGFLVFAFIVANVCAAVLFCFVNYGLHAWINAIPAMPWYSATTISLCAVGLVGYLKIRGYID